MQAAVCDTPLGTTMKDPAFVPAWKAARRRQLSEFRRQNLDFQDYRSRILNQSPYPRRKIDKKDLLVAQ